MKEGGNVGRWLRNFTLKKQKHLRALLKERDSLLKDKEKTKYLLRIFALWYQQNVLSVEVTLESFSSMISNELLLEVFTDLQVPWNLMESHVLLYYLDPNNDGFVDTEMVANLADLVLQESNSLDSGVMDSFPDSSGVLTADEIVITVRLATSFAPGSILQRDITVEKKITVGQLCHKLLKCLDPPTNRLVIKVGSCDGETLDEDCTLSSLQLSSPIDLFYDFSVGYMDCPLVGCDAYFIWRTVDRMIQL